MSLLAERIVTSLCQVVLVCSLDLWEHFFWSPLSPTPFIPQACHCVYFAFLGLLELFIFVYESLMFTRHIGKNKLTYIPDGCFQELNGLTNL